MYNDQKHKHTGGSYNRERTKPKPKPRRRFTAPIPAKPCVIEFNGIALFYARLIKALVVNHFDELDVHDEEVTHFPSHRQAKKAIWHSLQYYQQINAKKLDGGVYWHTDFVLVDE